jgi:cellulose synthase/poly-beta-1,6-N-acetylglucosamine synthase-like glycosyltransferase
LDYPKDRYEIIVVDDHSSDESARIVREFSQIYDNLRLLNQKIGKKGPAAARNLGIKQAKGEFIASTDSDEMMFSEWLNELLPYFSDSNIAAVGALLKESHPLDSGISPKIQSILINPLDKPSTVAAGNVVYRKKILQEIGGFNEFCSFNDLDVDLHYRLREKGFELIAVQKYLGQHKQRHSLKAFYKRMRGFGAAGLIIALLNSKKVFSDFENKNGLVNYLALFSMIIISLIAFIVFLFISPKLSLFILGLGLVALVIHSCFYAVLHIKRTKSCIFFLPILSFYLFVKMIALIRGLTYGFFYYLMKK